VTAYLRTVEPSVAVTAEQEYSCITATTVVISGACEAAAASVFNALAAREAQWGSSPAFHEALQAARVVVQNGSPAGEHRDASMAENAVWMRDHRGASGKVLLWAHNTHLAKGESIWAGEKPMGKLLATKFGSRYFVIGTMTAAGSFRQWDPRNSRHIVTSFPPLAPDAIETSIRQRGLPYLLIPLRGAVPSWLSAVAPYNTAAGSGDPGLEASLPEQFDAVIFIDTTTPLEAIRDN
jgi:erythromycin esterase-like protein